MWRVPVTRTQEEDRPPPQSIATPTLTHFVNFQPIYYLQPQKKKKTKPQTHQRPKFNSPSASFSPCVRPRLRWPGRSELEGGEAGSLRVGDLRQVVDGPGHACERKNKSVTAGRLDHEQNTRQEVRLVNFIEIVLADAKSKWEWKIMGVRHTAGMVSRQVRSTGISQQAIGSKQHESAFSYETLTTLTSVL